MSSRTAEPRLILSDSWGIYIPQMFVSDIGDDEAQTLGINIWALKQCQTGPDAPHYWEAWDEILNSCELRDEAGTVWRLYQSGDLWEIPDGFSFPDDF